MHNVMFTDEEIRIIQALQVDMPLVSEPYKQIADSIGITENRLLEVMQNLHERGCLKRMSIALRHNNVGYTINVMTAWNVDDTHLKEAGRLVSQNPKVTHCYARSRTAEFNYNFYAMVHATDEAEYAQLIHELKDIIQPWDYQELRTTAELKKIGMKYFVDDPYGGHKA